MIEVNIAGAEPAVRQKQKINRKKHAHRERAKGSEGPPRKTRSEARREVPTYEKRRVLSLSFARYSFLFSPYPHVFYPFFCPFWLSSVTLGCRFHFPPLSTLFLRFPSLSTLAFSSLHFPCLFCLSFFLFFPFLPFPYLFLSFFHFLPVHSFHFISLLSFPALLFPFPFFPFPFLFFPFFL